MGQIVNFLLLIFSIFKHDQIEFFKKFWWMLKVKEITNTAGRSKFFFLITILPIPIPSSVDENALCYSYNNCLELNNWKVTVMDINITNKRVESCSKIPLLGVHFLSEWRFPMCYARISIKIMERKTLKNKINLETDVWLLEFTGFGTRVL